MIKMVIKNDLKLQSFLTNEKKNILWNENAFPS